MDISKSITRIAIIGAGPSGIASAKYLLAERHFFTIDIYEQRDTLSGIWRYTPETLSGLSTVPPATPHSPPQPPVPSSSSTSASNPPTPKGRGQPVFIAPMYDRLETNIAKDLMCFSDSPFPDDDQLFPTHDQVDVYLRKYAEDVAHLVKLSTEVVDVRKKGDVWWVTSKAVTLNGTGRERTVAYDAVVVATGHYNVPYIPDIEGADEWNQMYPGSIGHSLYFRRGENYRDQKVVVVGNSASGSDIAAQISHHCSPPLHQSIRSESYLSTAALDNPLLTKHPPIASLHPASRTVTFTDGHTESDIDTILFCTGYFYSYPFLSSLQPPITDTGFRARSLYRQLLYIPDPTLAFTLLPQRIVPFPMAEAQAAYLARVWSHRLPLPDREAMSAWEAQRVSERGDGREFHFLHFPEDGEYINHMYREVIIATAESKRNVGKIPPLWGARELWMRERFPAIRKAFLERGEARREVRTIEELGFDYERWVEEEREMREGWVEVEAEDGVEADGTDEVQGNGTGRDENHS